MLSMLSNGRIYRHACFDSNGLHADQLKRVGCAAGVGAGKGRASQSKYPLILPIDSATSFQTRP
jgi:hypothetical protein